MPTYSHNLKGHFKVRDSVGKCSISGIWNKWDDLCRKNESPISAYSGEEHEKGLYFNQNECF